MQKPQNEAIPPVPTDTAPAKPLTTLQQNWLNANEGPYANLLLNSLNRSEPYGLDPLHLQWTNFSTGRGEGMTRGVGIVQQESGKELAALLGGTLVQSPFNIYGAQQRDAYIRMPNGQMIDASVLANNLNAAREARDPFSAIQSMLQVYQIEAGQFDLNRSTDAIDGINTGRLLSLPNGLPT